MYKIKTRLTNDSLIERWIVQLFLQLGSDKRKLMKLKVKIYTWQTYKFTLSTYYDASNKAEKEEVKQGLIQSAQAHVDLLNFLDASGTNYHLEDNGVIILQGRDHMKLYISPQGWGLCKQTNGELTVSNSVRLNYQKSEQNYGGTRIESFTFAKEDFPNLVAFILRHWKSPDLQEWADVWNHLQLVTPHIEARVEIPYSYKENEEEPPYVQIKSGKLEFKVLPLLNDLLSVKIGGSLMSNDFDTAQNILKALKSLPAKLAATKLSAAQLTITTTAIPKPVESNELDLA